MRPALVLTPAVYNARSELAVVCAITSQVKGYPFEVAIPPGSPIKGVVLTDQIRTIDWKSRAARFRGKCGTRVLAEVEAKMRALLKL